MRDLIGMTRYALLGLVLFAPWYLQPEKFMAVSQVGQASPVTISKSAILLGEEPVLFLHQVNDAKNVRDLKLDVNQFVAAGLSNDRKTLAFAARSGILDWLGLYDIPNKAIHAGLLKLEEGQIEKIIFAPDDRNLVVEFVPASGLSDLALIDREGKSQIVLSSLQSIKQPYHLTYPEWRDGGKTLVFKGNIPGDQNVKWFYFDVNSKTLR